MEDENGSREPGPPGLLGHTGQSGHTGWPVGQAPAEAAPAAPAGVAPAAPAQVVRPLTIRAPETGEPRVDAALRLLDDLTELPVAEHPAIFGQVHAQLTEVLDELGSGPLARPAGRGNGAG